MIQDRNINQFGSSEHEVLLRNVIDVNNTNSKMKKWNYSNINVTAMNDFFASVEWADILSSNNINDNLVTIKNIILDVRKYASIILSIIGKQKY